MSAAIGEASGVTIWRTTKLARGAAVGTAAFLGMLEMLAFLAGVTESAVPLMVSFIAAILLAATAWLCWALAFHPRIELHPDRLQIVDPARTLDIPLASIRRAAAGYRGIEITFVCDGTMRFVSAWAVQKANASQILKRTVRADVIALAIERAAGLRTQ